MSKLLEDVVLVTKKKLKLTEEEQSKRMEENRRQDKIARRRLGILLNRRNVLNKKIEKLNVKLNKLAEERRHINSYQSRLVSEKAFIEYLRDYKGLDISAIQEEIANLPDQAVIRKGQKIIELKERS